MASLRVGAFIVNLDGRPDRWAAAAAEWGGVLPHVTRFAAVARPDRPVTGCAASVMTLVDAYLGSGALDLLVVVEDDAVRTPAWDAWWPRVLADAAATLDQWHTLNTGPVLLDTPLPLTPFAHTDTLLRAARSLNAQCTLYSRALVRDLGRELAHVRAAIAANTVGPIDRVLSGYDFAVTHVVPRALLTRQRPDWSNIDGGFKDMTPWYDHAAALLAAVP